MVIFKKLITVLEYAKKTSIPVVCLFLNKSITITNIIIGCLKTEWDIWGQLWDKVVQCLFTLFQWNKIALQYDRQVGAAWWIIYVLMTLFPPQIYLWPVCAAMSGYILPVVPIYPISQIKLISAMQMHWFRSNGKCTGEWTFLQVYE